MAYDDTTLANMALGHIGVSEEIADVSTEASAAAAKCNLFLLQAKESTLEAFAWPEATQYTYPGLVENFTTLQTAHDWDYSYRYPSDCVMVRRIVTVLGRQDPNPPPYKIGSDSTARLIYTNEIDAYIEYTKRLVDPNFYGALLAEAVSWRLASFIAPSLSRIKGMQTTAMGIFDMIVGKAKVKGANEQQHSEPPESDFIRARD